MIVLARWMGTPEGWKAALQPRGTWYAYPIGPHAMPGEWTIGGVRYCLYVGCPACGRVMELSSKVHQVKSDGTGRPSLVCAFEDRGCRWHVMARLEGWRENLTT